MIKSFLHTIIKRLESMDVLSIIWVFKRLFYLFLIWNTCTYLLIDNYLWGEKSVVMVDFVSELPFFLQEIVRNTIGEYNFHWTFISVQLIFSVFAFFGILPRLSAALVWFASAKIWTSAFVVTNGSILIAANYSFFLIFMSDNKKQSESSLWLTNTFFIVCIIQLVVIYFFSTLFKVAEEYWINGQGLYLSLNFDLFTLQSIKPYLNEYPKLMLAGNYITLIYQFLFPFLLLSKKLKKYSIGFGIFFHHTILILTGIVDFSIIMLILYSLFLSNEFCELLRSKVTTDFRFFQQSELQE